MATRLGNLHPKWLETDADRPKSGEGVSFDCPACGDKKPHRVSIFFLNPVDGKPNTVKADHQRSGADDLDFGTLSIAPAVQEPCGLLGWIECGNFFGIKDSPIVVLTMGANGQRPVALSPLQTIEGCGTAIQRAKVLLGQGATGEKPPAQLIRASDGIMLIIGDVKTRFWAGQDVVTDEMLDLARDINIVMGYYPDEPMPIPLIEQIERPKSQSIIIPGA